MWSQNGIFRTKNNVFKVISKQNSTMATRWKLFLSTLWFEDKMLSSIMWHRKCCWWKSARYAEDSEPYSKPAGLIVLLIRLAVWTQPLLGSTVMVMVQFTDSILIIHTKDACHCVLEILMELKSSSLALSLSFFSHSLLSKRKAARAPCGLT